MNSGISVAGIEKAYGDLRVLRGVDLEVEPGQILALLGSNGACKTTLVRILATLLSADAGSATVAGRNLTDEPARVREAMSLTGQFAAVDEVLTGRENLALIAKLRHLDRSGEVADELLQRFSLSETVGRRVSTYSGACVGGSTRSLGCDSGVGSERENRAAHHAVSRGGRAPRGPDRHPARRAHSREWYPCRTQITHAAREGGVRRETAHA